MDQYLTAAMEIIRTQGIVAFSASPANVPEL